MRTGEKSLIRSAGLAALMLGLAACHAGPRSHDVLLVIVDTVRSDHLGCYGYDRDTTPNIDSLAAQGTRWSRVQAQSSWTLPAIASIMTGLDDRTHRAGMFDGVFYGIDPELPFLPHLMSRGGFQTAAFFNVIFLDACFGFNRGFDHFDCVGSVETANMRDAGTTVDRVLEWLDSDRDPDRPFFIALHIYDAHLTYDPPPPYASAYTDPAYSGPFGPDWGTKSDVSAVNQGGEAVAPGDLYNLEGLYDGEISYVDSQLGRLFEGLRSRGLSSTTLIVVMADHGEEFMDHGGLGHGHTLYQELLSIPLIMSGPGVRAGFVDTTLAGEIDVAPTILAYSGLPVPDQMHGVDVLRAHSGRRALPASLLMTTGGRVAIRSGDEKLHWSQSTGQSVQFDLASDPREAVPLAAVDSSLVRDAEFFWATPALGHPAPVSLAEAAENALRNLGYIR